MKIDLEKHPDGGCWISDDRVNAFISARSGGVGEVGFHGLQPVSKNSRILVSREGVLTVSIRTSEDIPLACPSVEWAPGSVETSARRGEKEYVLRIGASGRSLMLFIAGHPGEEAEAVIRFSFRSLFTGVHGARTWGEPHIDGGTLELSCRDRIELQEWLSREGAYAGDFLIPEPWRRLIFKRRCGSGLATREDLRDEFRGARFVLYDARTLIRIGGEGFAPALEKDVCTFTARLSRGNTWRASLALRFAEEGGHSDERGTPGALQRGNEVPDADVTGHDHTRGFFRNVPGIVRSCTLADTGMTRGTPGAYYWTWTWDNLVTALEMPRWGDARGAARIVRFINAHRDEGGAIPARWTRTHQPLDTPPRGTFEFLLLLAALQCEREGTGAQEVNDIYPFAVKRLDEAARRARDGTLEENIGFYPDLPVKFGRSESSAVAMESGTLYAFCRLLETAALERGDGDTASRAADTAGRVQKLFEEMFWDEEAGFPVDSVDVRTGTRNDTYPLFTLMFLQTPLGIPLIRPHIRRMAGFAAGHFQTGFGTRLLPPGDRRSSGEDALSSWYPHWDIYLLKLLRRGGMREGILAWLRSTERVCDRLGYAPEFLALGPLERNEPGAWERHGAVSNLNCATGWYRAIVEGLFGLETDSGGISVVPLDLEIPRMVLRGLIHRGARWEISVENRGGSSADIRVDGTPVRGCTKIPSPCYDGGPHALDIAYVAGEAPPRFTEIVNAEVIETTGDENGARVVIRGFGTVDIAFPSPSPVELAIDGKRAEFSSADGSGYLQVPLAGKHTLALRKK